MQSKAPRVIAYTGAHGTGKTTAVYARAAELKRELPGATVGILCETAAVCPLPINRQATPASQLWIFSAQIKTELELMPLYDVLVSDRSALDAVAYTKARGFHELAEAMFNVFLEHAAIYSEICLMRIGGDCHPDGRRDTDPAWRRAVEDILMDYYARAGIAGQDRFVIGPALPGLAVA